eukprot:jgi/Mesvir1/241/Mv13584-RA.1
MQSPSRPFHNATLTHVMAVPGVGAQISGALPLLERCRLRSTGCAFLSAVDESLEGLTELFWEDIAEVANKPGGLDWLLRKCPNLHTLSFWPRGGHKMHPWDLTSFESKALTSVTMPSQSLLGLARCRRLRSLNLAGCADVDDITLAAVASSCRELEVLDITRCHVTDKSIIVVAQFCPGLRELSANTVKRLTDASLEQLAQHCPQLQRLRADNSAVTDAGISAIVRRCPDLRLLEVNYSNGVTDASLMRLAEWCPALEYLGLSGLKLITDASIIAIARGCPALRGLDLSRSELVTDAALREVANGYNQLEWLRLDYMEVSSPVLQEVARGCPRLRYLDAQHAGLEGLNDEVVKELAAKCTDLRYLTLAPCPNITDAGITALAGGCQQLESLHLSCISEHVTDVGFAAIAQGCPRLKRLYLWECDGVTDASLSLVGEHCQGLEELTLVTGNVGITEVSLSVIARNCARLRVVKIALGSTNPEPALRVIVEHCTQLEQLVISGVQCPLHACMAAIGRNCARLRLFRAANCGMLTDADVAMMFQGPVGKHLLHLDISYNCVGDVALAAVANACPQLRVLSVVHGARTNVTAVGVQSIAAGCRQLTNLNLRGITITGALKEALERIDKRRCNLVLG